MPVWSTYLIGPFLNEFNMFLELVADAEVVLPSTCFDRLIDELRPPPPAVDCVLGWLLRTRLDGVGLIFESALGV